MNRKSHPIYEFPEMNSHERLRELIVYIADRCTTDEGFSLSKLAKILYYADFASYRDRQTPITGYPYVHWDFGPVPKDYYAILDEMKASGELFIQPRKYFNREQKRPIAQREPDASIFSGRDIQIVEDIIHEYWDRSASDTSTESHGIAWKLVGKNEPIPYQASLFSDDPLTDEEIAHAHEIAKEYGLECV